MSTNSHLPQIGVCVVYLCHGSYLPHKLEAIQSISRLCLLYKTAQKSVQVTLREWIKLSHVQTHLFPWRPIAPEPSYAKLLPRADTDLMI